MQKDPEIALSKHGLVDYTTAAGSITVFEHGDCEPISSSRLQAVDPGQSIRRLLLPVFRMEGGMGPVYPRGHARLLL